MRKMLAYTGPSATVLRNGRAVAPGTPIDPEELEAERKAVEADEENGTEGSPAVAAERDFYDEHGWVEEIELEDEADEAEKLRGEALKTRAEELDIEGRTTMNADELRAAVAAAEAAQAAGGDE